MFGQFQAFGEQLQANKLPTASGTPDPLELTTPTVGPSGSGQVGSHGSRQGSSVAGDAEKAEQEGSESDDNEDMVIERAVNSEPTPVVSVDISEAGRRKF